jgi:hypothetical protein
MDTAVIETFIARFEERVAPVEKALGEAWWDLSTTGTEEAQRELVHAGTEYNRLFADRDEYASVRGWYEGRGSLEISLLRRQVEVLYRAFAGRQGDEETLTRIEELEAEANAVFGNHRGTVGEKEARENEIREILRSSDDEALRREAWEAQKGVGREAEGIVRELARLRNRLARGGLREPLRPLAGPAGDRRRRARPPPGQPRSRHEEALRGTKREGRRGPQAQVRGRAGHALAPLGPVLPELQKRPGGSSAPGFAEGPGSWG